MFKAKMKPLELAVVLAGLGPVMPSAPVSAASDLNSAATIRAAPVCKPFGAGKPDNPVCVCRSHSCRVWPVSRQPGVSALQACCLSP